MEEGSMMAKGCRNPTTRSATQEHFPWDSLLFWK
jgi:hypothetical protein